jgi:hypothetical protein
MGGKAKKEQRRAYEARAASRGNALVTVRLGPGANRMLRAICDSYQCTPRDVVEGLLLGNVKPVTERPLGLSNSEVEYAELIGVALK